MHRFYVESIIAGPGEAAVLSPEESAHAARVLRLRPGEEVRLLDGLNLWTAVLETVDAKAVVARVGERCPSPEPPCRVALFQGLPKADKLEMITQKGTELGMWELWPVQMERSVVKAADGGKKQERLSRIALEAAKQSGRAHVPAVIPPLSFDKALDKAAAEGYDCILVAWEEERALPLSQAVERYTRARGVPEKALIVIGPEGGISRREWEALKARGAVSVTLGRRILRTETAGLCALSVLWAALGEM